MGRLCALSRKTSEGGVLVFFLVYAISSVFQLYNGSDMMYEMSWRKPELTFLPSQGIFNLPHHIGLV